MSRADWAWILLVVAAAALVRCFGLGDLPPFIDESGHIRFVNDLHPDFFSLGKILGQYVFRPVVNNAAHPLEAVRLLVAILGVLTALVLYWLGRLLGNGPWPGVVAGLLWALQPFVVFHDRLALHDPLISFFHAASLLAAVLAFRHGSLPLAAAAGVLSGCAAMVKFPMIVLVITVLAISFAVTPTSLWKARFRLVGVMAITCILSFGVMWPDRAKFGAFGKSGVVATAIEGRGFSENFQILISWLSGYNTIWFVLLLLVCLWFAIAKRQWLALLLASASLAPMLLACAVLGFVFARYFLPYLIPLTLFLALILPLLFVRSTSSLRTAGVVLLGLFALLMGTRMVAVDTAITRDPYHAEIPLDDHMQYLTGWPSAIGVRETIAFLKAQAQTPGAPILLAVAGFGRHGSWEVEPALKGVAGIETREIPALTEGPVATLLDAASTRRVYILEELPWYELKGAEAKVLFTYERKIERSGRSDGALRVVELAPGTQLLSALPEGPPVQPNEPPSIESINNPNGLEGKFFWVGAGATRIQLRSGAATTVQLTATFSAGPSLSGKADREVLVKTSSGYEQVVRLAAGPGVLTVPVPAGRTTVTLASLDKVNVPVMPNGDKRPMLLGVEGLTLKSVAGRCSAEYGPGLHGEEKSAEMKAVFRWSPGTLELRITSATADTLEISAGVISLVRPEQIEVTVNQKKVGSIAAPASPGLLTPMPTLEIAVPPGPSTVVFRADKPGIKAGADPRTLNFALANLKLRSKTSKQACEIR